MWSTIAAIICGSNWISAFLTTSDIDKAENIIREAAARYYENHKEIMAGRTFGPRRGGIDGFPINIR